MPGLLVYRAYKVCKVCQVLVFRAYRVCRAFLAHRGFRVCVGCREFRVT
jgi:hypothetical protein